MILIEKDLYVSILENMPIVCVDLLVQRMDTKQVLFVERKNKPEMGSLWFPGGRLKKGETLKHCAHRKLNQELGLNSNLPSINNKGIIHVDETIFDDGPHDMIGGVHSVNFVYHIELLEDVEIVLDDQSSRYFWLYECLLEFHPYLKTSLNKINY